jgi:hypothetical protein
VTVRPWATAAGERLQDFIEYSAEALETLVTWIVEAWDTVWADLKKPPAAQPSAPRLQRARAAGSHAARFLNARSATWALGIAFVALLVLAVRSPDAVSVSAAQPQNAIVLDADAIEPVDEPESDSAASSGDAALNADERESDAESNGAIKSASGLEVPLALKAGSEKAGVSDDTDSAESAEAKAAEAKEGLLLQRARAGDRAAIVELSSREPTSLSLEEVQALAVGEEKVAREKTTQEVLKIAQKRRLEADDRSAFLRHVGNPRTYREALLAMAENRSWQGPDLIYLAMRRYRSQKHVVEFARSLLLTPRIYKYASPALTVVIDAESMSAEPTSSGECFHVRQLADRAFEDGDSRAVLHMARFASTTGCGTDDSEDCYPCLRDDSALVDALRAAKTRQPPY